MPPPSPGFDASSVAPSDAIVTMRSLLRRFSETFDQADRPADVVSAPAAGGLSALEHAAWTATALEMIRTALRQVLMADDPSVELPAVEPAGPAGPGTAGAGDDPGTVLVRLGEVARRLADSMAEVHGEAWSRTGQTATGEVSALGMARLAVQIGIDHLRGAQWATGPGRGRD